MRVLSKLRPAPTRFKYGCIRRDGISDNARRFPPPTDCER